MSKDMVDDELEVPSKKTPKFTSPIIVGGYLISLV